MTAQTDPPIEPPSALLRMWGLWGLVISALALVLAFVVIAGPSLEPQPSTATQIGEIAGEMKRAAWRSFFGLATSEPEVIAVTWKDWLPLAIPALGATGIILSVISRVRGENRQFLVYGTTLGAAAIFFHFFWMAALLIIGAVIIMGIIANLGSFFSF